MLAATIVQDGEERLAHHHYEAGASRPSIVPACSICPSNLSTLRVFVVCAS